VHELNQILSERGLSMPIDGPAEGFSYIKVLRDREPTYTWVKRIGQKLNDTAVVFRQSLMGIRPIATVPVASDWDFKIWSLGYPEGLSSRQFARFRRCIIRCIFGRFWCDR
jgi:hypothetical protein